MLPLLFPRAASVFHRQPSLSEWKNQPGFDMTAAMTAPYRLHYAPDNASLIIRLVLEELGQPYRTVLVDRSREEQTSAAFRALNPAGRIPVLITPQGPMFETGAILLWLADTHHAMAPAPDHMERADFLKWLFFTCNTLHTDLLLLFYANRYVGPDTAAQYTLRETLKPRLAEHLGHLDAVASGAPSWLCETRPSVLTYYVACLMRWMALYPRDHDRSWFLPAETPHLKRILASLETRPAVTAAQRAEGLGPTPFTAPVHCNPPEGSPV
jgi:glutathione S-transferase